MRYDPQKIDVTKLDDNTFEHLFRLAIGDTPGIDNPFNDEEHCIIIQEAWKRGYVEVAQGLRKEWEATDQE